jgi:hypothetical protein
MAGKKNESNRPGLNQQKLPGMSTARSTMYQDVFRLIRL